jgi:hypothetical protein
MSDLKNDHDKWNEFEFPRESSSKGNLVMKYIVFAVSVLFVPSLFVLLLFQIQKLKDAQTKPMTALDTLVGTINRGGLKIQVNSETSPSDIKVSLNVPPINLSISTGGAKNDPNIEPRTITTEMVEELIGRIGAISTCNFCSQYKFKTVRTSLDFKIGKESKETDKKALSDLLRLAKRAKDQVLDDRIRFNFQSKKGSMPNLSYVQSAKRRIHITQKGNLKFGFDSKDNAMCIFIGDKLNNRLIELEKNFNEIDSKKADNLFRSDSSFYSEVIALLEKEVYKFDTSLDTHNENLGILSKIKSEIKNLESRCDAYRLLVRQDTAFVNSITPMLKTSKNGDFTKQFEKLNQIFELQSSQWISLNDRIIEAKAIIDDSKAIIEAKAKIDDSKAKDLLKEIDSIYFCRKK